MVCQTVIDQFRIHMTHGYTYMSHILIRMFLFCFFQVRNAPSKIFAVLGAGYIQLVICIAKRKIFQKQLGAALVIKYLLKVFLR